VPAAFAFREDPTNFIGTYIPVLIVVNNLSISDTYWRYGSSNCIARSKIT
jgi:hypothetical protein